MEKLKVNVFEVFVICLRIIISFLFIFMGTKLYANLNEMSKGNLIITISELYIIFFMCFSVLFADKKKSFITASNFQVKEKR
jgi:amino acid transporter